MATFENFWQHLCTFINFCQGFPNCLLATLGCLASSCYHHHEIMLCHAVIFSSCHLVIYSSSVWQLVSLLILELVSHQNERIILCQLTFSNLIQNQVRTLLLSMCPNLIYLLKAVTRKLRYQYHAPTLAQNIVNLPQKGPDFETYNITYLVFLLI